MTKNSLVETVPITYLGSILFLDNSKGVLTGPQPPPPIASKKPAIAPCGTSKNPDNLPSLSSLFFAF